MTQERTVEADRRDTQGELARAGQVVPSSPSADVSTPRDRDTLRSQAVGAAAIGALAIGRLAVGRMRVGRFHGRRLRIDELEIGRLRVGELVRPGAERVKRRYLRNE